MRPVEVIDCCRSETPGDGDASRVSCRRRDEDLIDVAREKRLVCQSMSNLAGHTAATDLGPQMPPHHKLGIARAEGKQGRAAEELAVIGRLHCPQALRQRTLSLDPRADI
jgi:hypothetical protein